MALVRYAGASTWHQPPLAPGIWPAEALRYPLRALSPWPAAPALLAAALVALTGCASNQASSAPRPSAAPSPPVVKDGHLTLSPLSLRCGILGVTGTHSEAPPEGEFGSSLHRVGHEG